MDTGPWDQDIHQLLAAKDAEIARLRADRDEALALLGWSQHRHIGITGGGSVPEGYIEGPEWRRRVRALRGEGE